MVVNGFISPHGCEYFPNGAEVLIDGALFDGDLLCGNNSGADVLGIDLEKGDGVFDALEIGCGVHPAVELSPLTPGCGVFLEDYLIKTLGRCLMYSMLVSYLLHSDVSWSRRQILLCGNFMRKYQRKIRPES